MEKKLWEFSDTHGTFESKSAHRVSGLYFPLCNEGFMSSITPDLHGDSKSGQNSFLLPPVSRIDLSTSKASRNFWVNIENKKIWSATGVSKFLGQQKNDVFSLRAGLLWHEVKRENKILGLAAEVKSFVPYGAQALEIMQVCISNISRKKIVFTPTAAIPLYARSAYTIRDHRHVTSLLQRIKLHKFGILSQPTLSFDEAGHSPNNTIYFVLGWDTRGNPPRYFYPTQEMFCGEAGDLEAPLSVLENRLPDESSVQGKEAMGALRFNPISLGPGEKCTYTVALGVGSSHQDVEGVLKEFRGQQKLNKALSTTQAHWVKVSSAASVTTKDANFDTWFRWVNIQPTLRRIFGCSFLPDFDYGLGGRGWRDLWQDCLSLILTNPKSVRALLINNFSGVRIDGSNATIIGKKSGEFIADRNNISRVWMDHGIWPLLTLDLFLNETGQYDILFEEASYFRDHQIERSSGVDSAWNPACGNTLKTASGHTYRGTLLEHLLVQHLVQFFNVGAHNHIRLEGADWNDGLDMAREKGESVAFSAMYAHNLALLARILATLGKPKVKVAAELLLLLRRVKYDDPRAKQRLLRAYYSRVHPCVSGRKISIDTAALISNLTIKSKWIMQHIRKKEWLKKGFFNGYYDNKSRRVEGAGSRGVRMMLASQVFPVMSGVAEERQIRSIIRSVKKYLYDKKLGGIHLNTDFVQEQHDLGRAFSFAYGDKENGAFFNHMTIMYAYALYKRGFVKEGWEALRCIYEMALNTEKSRIYPCIPEYFNSEGRGMYAYLTGSASWFVLTLLTQAFGIKGKNGDLCIEPKLTKSQFKHSPVIKVTRNFLGKQFEVAFSNPEKLEYGQYRIVNATLNSRAIRIQEPQALTISRKTLSGLPHRTRHTLSLVLR